MSGLLRILLCCGSGLAVLASALSGEETRSEKNSLGIEMRLIEGGRMVRGTDGGERALTAAFPLSVSAQFFGNPEAPAHVTWITRPFWIAATEVTVGQWKQFVEETGYVTTAEKSGAGIVGWSPTPEDKPLYQSHDFERKPEFTWRNPGFPQEDSHPVVGVSWLDAQAFLAWLSEREGVTYRLPTEAEWEFACRAGSETWFSFGDEVRGIVHRQGNLGNVELEKHRRHSVERQWLLDWENEPEDGHVFTAPVGSYEANPFGLHDLHGNVWEWCQDLWLDTFYKRYDWPKRGEPREIAVDPVNLSEPQTNTNQFRTIRGGSWYNGPVICRSASRVAWDEPDAAAYLGFRVVREASSDISSRARDSFEREERAREAIEAAGGKFSSSRGLDLALRFEGRDFPREALPFLRDLPGIVQLSFSPKETVALSDADLEAIVAMPDLAELSFQSSFDLDSVDLGILARLPSLRGLAFSRSTSLDDEDLEKMASLSSLVRFEAWGTGGGLTDRGISRLAGNRDLEVLRLSEVDAEGGFLPLFLGCLLREITVTGRYSSERGLRDEHATRLSEFLDLEEVTLSQQGRLTDRTLSSLSRLEKLQELGLQGCAGISADGFQPLAALSQLRVLNLQGTAAGDEAVAALSQIPRLANLRIGSPHLTDRGFADLARVFSLQDLYIQTSRATDEGVRQLGRINRLKRLDLGVPAMTGSGLGPISRLPELEDLRLRSPALTDLVFATFSRAKSLRKLRLVERGWQPPAALTDGGLQEIASATWLTELWLPRNDTGLTEAAIEDLNQRMSKTNVIAYSVDWKRPEAPEPKGDGK